MAKMNDTVYFNIPLVGYQNEQQWRFVCRSLRYTLNSVFDQTHEAVSAIVVGHDCPDIEEIRDSRVTYLESPFPRPEPDKRLHDKSRKRIVAADYVRQVGGRFLGILDADDILAKDVARTTVRANMSMVFRSGYAYDQQRKILAKIPGVVRSFYTFCGSCIILSLDQSELPKLVGTKIINRECLFQNLGSHQHFPDSLKEKNKEFGFIDEPCAIYMLYNQVNLSFSRRENYNHDWLRSSLGRNAVKVSDEVTDMFPILKQVMMD